MKNPPDKNPKIVELEQVVIKFSGDSGDGMQLTGTQFSNTSALEGMDVSTYPDYPAEIRAPSGTVAGVSGFQLHFGHKEVYTPGDFADVLIALNPAALKANLQWVKPGGIIIVDRDTFTERNFEKANYKSSPLKSKSIRDNYSLISEPITSLVRGTLNDIGLDNKSILRTRNMFALGLVYWMFNMPLEHTLQFFEDKFKKIPVIMRANKMVLRAGYYYAETLELSRAYRVQRAEIEPGTYRNVNGNLATAWGLLAAAEKSKRPLFLGSYPITPASEILQEISKRKDLGARAFQAEDEIAGICTAIGASFAGALAVTSTSGPGLALKAEALGLAIIVELPLVVVNVQRGGPSTGLPTKTEQSDLMQALYGRNGESPVMVMAASTPSNCYEFAFLAAKYAIEHMTPVILLTDSFLANGSEPWRIQSTSTLPDIEPPIAKARRDEDEAFMPYKRDAIKLARKWAVVGTPGLEHRIGGLEKDMLTGNVSYSPANHEEMTRIRAEKIQRIQEFIPELPIDGNDSGKLLVVGWGGTYGHLLTAVHQLQNEGKDVSLAHFHYINPLPVNTEAVFESFEYILICELNMGQFANYLRMHFPRFNYLQYNKVRAQPFTVWEIRQKVEELLNSFD